MSYCRGGKRIGASAELLQKFEVRRTSRDIINYGGATMYEVLPWASKEGKGVYYSIAEHSGLTKFMTDV